MSVKNLNFDDKKVRKSTFYRNKTINTIENIDTNNMLKHTVIKIHLNPLLDTVIMILLDRYV